MVDAVTPYERFEPAQLIAADRMNIMQVDIKKDIQARIEAVKAEITKAGVDRAGNADKFDNRSPKDWTDVLDQRYAGKVHDHEGMAAYRRYIKEFTADTNAVLLEHKLGRFPLVDIYELLPVTNKQGFADCKLLFYYGQADIDDFNLWVRVYRDRIPLGLPFEQVLAELGVQYDDDDTIEDVLNDLWAAFLRDPNDKIKHCTSPWVEECCGQRRTVADLKRADQWNDLYLAIKPRKCGKSADTAPPKVEVAQINYNTLLLEAQGLAAGAAPLDLMIVLRS